MEEFEENGGRKWRRYNDKRDVEGNEYFVNVVRKQLESQQGGLVEFLPSPDIFQEGFPRSNLLGFCICCESG